MNCKQDMPPVGGYPPIVYKQVPLKPGMNAALRLASLVCFSGLGMVGFHYTKNKLNMEQLEMRCADQAIHPMILAELDRTFLKQIRNNRDLEEKLMKDNPDWEVGKFKNIPVFMSLDPDEFIMPTLMEYYVHNGKNVPLYVKNFNLYL